MKKPHGSARGENGVRPAPSPVSTIIVLKDSDRKKNTAAASPLENGSHSNSESFQWHAAAAAIQKHFPRTEDGFAEDLAARCRIVIENEGGDSDKLTDEALADVIQAAWKPGQQTAGLSYDSSDRGTQLDERIV